MVKAGLFGPRLTGLVALMKGVCHARFVVIDRRITQGTRSETGRRADH